jgi:hypothetical protein
MKNIRYVVKNFLFCFIRPSFWLQNEPTCPFLDEWIRDHINSGTLIERYSEHYVIIDKRKVWVANYPYAYGSVSGQNALPRGMTRKLLRDCIAKQEFHIPKKRTILTVVK